MMWENHQQYLWRVNNGLWLALFERSLHGILFNGEPYEGVGGHDKASVEDFKSFVEEVERWTEAHPDWRTPEWAKAKEERFYLAWVSTCNRHLTQMNDYEEAKSAAQGENQEPTA